MDQEHLEATIACACNVWVEANIIARALAMTAEEYLPTARSICQRALDDDLGLIVVDNRSGDVVGFHLAIDFRHELAVAEAIANGHAVEPKMKRWIAFLGQAYEAYLARFHPPGGRPLQPGQVLYLKIGGMQRHWRNQGWMFKLGTAAFRAHALGRGYQRAFMVATHAHSTRMLRHLPHQPIADIEFATLEDPDLSRISSPRAAVAAYVELDDLR